MTAALDLVILEEVGPFVHEDDPDRLSYRHCDFCHRPAWENAAADFTEPWYWMPVDGLSVCGECVPEITEVSQ